MKDTNKIEFTESERAVVAELWDAYIAGLTMIARLRGYKGQQLSMIKVSDDRSGMELVQPPSTEVKRG